MNNKLVSFAFACVFVSACGGGSGSESTPGNPTPATPSNTAPIANNDSAIIQNGALSSINVLANDTDANNQTLSISRITQAPNNGTATINGTNIDYIPNSGYLGADTLTYEVSDGSLSDTAQISITSKATLTIEGKVAKGDSAISSIDIEINGESTSSQIDNEGNYSASVELSSYEGDVWLRATDGAQISLSSYAGSVDDLLAVRNEQFVVNPALAEGVLVDELSTAKIILVKKWLGADERPSADVFVKALAQYTDADFYNLAAHITLLVNDAEVLVNSGETLESLFVGESTIASDLEDNLIAYLFPQGFLQQFSLLSEAYKLKQIDAITNLLEANGRVLSFSEQELQGIRLFETPYMFNYARNRVDPNTTQTKEYASNNTGKYFDDFASSINDFSWTIDDGQVSETYQPVINENTDRAYYISPNDAKTAAADFGSDALGATEESLATGGSVALIRQLKHVNITKVGEQNGYLEILLESTFLETLEVQLPLTNEVQFFTRNNVNHTFTNALSSLQTESELLNQNSIVGRWSIPLLELDWSVEVNDQVTEPEELILDRVITFNTDGSANIDGTNDAISWTIIGGVLTIDRGDNNTSTKLTVLTGENDELFVQGEYLLNGELYIVRGGRMVKSNIDPMAPPSLITEEPLAWLTYSQNAYNSQAIDMQNQASTFRYVFGYLINNDATMGRISSSLAEFNDEVDTFRNDADTNLWTYEIDNDKVLFKQNKQFGTLQQRQWQLLREADDGFLIVIERVNTEGRPDIGFEPRSFIRDRLLYLKKDDLSAYSSAYEQAVLDGVFN